MFIIHFGLAEQQLTKGRARKPKKTSQPYAKPRSNSPLPLITPTPEALGRSVQSPPEVEVHIQSPVISQLLAPKASQVKNEAPSKPTPATSLNDVPKPLKDEEISTKIYTSPALSTRAEAVSSSPSVSSPISDLYETEKEDRHAVQLSPNSKHSRIPSSGKRATVMDVAQALHEQSSKQGLDTVDEIRTNSNPPAIPKPRPALPFAANGEKRKSSYEKYSSIILPPLKEETTPVPSPAGTLSRAPGDTQRQTLESGHLPSNPPTNTSYVHSGTQILLTVHELFHSMIS